MQQFLIMGVTLMGVWAGAQAAQEIAKRTILPVNRQQALDCTEKVSAAEVKEYFNATDPFDQFSAQTCLIQIKKYIHKNAEDVPEPLKELQKKYKL